MNAELLEFLLHEGESITLDYKRDQYPFAGASDHQKSELLKDVLAFANAWRRADAYILLGVEEVKGERPVVRGIADHLDDADLQQFVNSKLNRRIVFSYRAFVADGVSIGVIHIPVQEERPFYLKSGDYGKLKRNVVYVRRGTSTDEATPDDIYLMGKAKAEADTRATARPTLDLRFIDIDANDADVGTTIQVRSEVVEVRWLPKPRVNPDRGVAQIEAMLMSRSLVNEEEARYKQSLAEYVARTRLLHGFEMRLKNTGGVLLVNPRLELMIPKGDSIVATDESDYPERPRRERGLLHSHLLRPLDLHYAQDRISVEEHADEWFVHVSFGNVQPQARTTASGALYLGAHEASQITTEAVIYADNLSAPVRIPLSLDFLVTRVEVRENELEEMAKDEDEEA